MTHYNERTASVSFAGCGPFSQIRSHVSHVLHYKPAPLLQWFGQIRSVTTACSSEKATFH